MTLWQLKTTYGGQHEDGYRGKIDVRRIRLDRDGYSPSGRYFGAGAPLFNVTDKQTGGSIVDFEIRAGDVAAARAKIQEAYPGAVSAKRR